MVSVAREATCEAGVGCGGALSTAAQRMAKPALSCDPTAKLARIVAPSTVTGTADVTAIWLGPPKVRPPSSVRRRRGLTSPYSGRGASSMTMSTRPLTPSTVRSSS